MKCVPNSWPNCTCDKPRSLLSWKIAFGSISRKISPLVSLGLYPLPQKSVKQCPIPRPKDCPSPFPISPCSSVYAELARGFVDGPTHLPTLSLHALRERPRRWERVITEEPRN